MNLTSSDDTQAPVPKSQSRMTQALVLISLLLLVAFTWLWVGLWWPSQFATQKDELGQFGDQFGSVNSLFAGLAFAGLSYTIWLQRTEIALQRHDLKLTRDEMKASVAAQESSAKALSAQLKLQAVAAELNALTAIMTHHHAELIEARKLGGVEGPALERKRMETERCHSLLSRSQSRVDECLVELKKCSVHE